MPVFNGEDFVVECLESIINTTYPKLNVIVIDDGCTDGTPKKVEQFANQRSNLRILKHSGSARRGVSASRNLGIREATGEYICFIDADDLMLPHRFDKAVELLSQNASLDGVIDSVEIRLENEKARREWGSAPLIFGCDVDVKPADFLRATLIEKRCRVCTPGMLVRKEMFKRAGLYRERMTRSEDFHLWLRFAACGRFAVGDSDRPVALYRRHGANTWVPNPADSLVDLEVLFDVLLWARRKSFVDQANRAVLDEVFRNKFFFCISMLREEGEKIKGLRAASIGLCGDWTLIYRRRFWGNVLKSALGCKTSGSGTGASNG